MRLAPLAAAAALLALLPVAALADSLTFPTAQSPNGQRINDLYVLITWFAVPVLVLVEAAIIFTAFRYRNRPLSEVQQRHGNTSLEIIWTVIPAIIIGIIAVAAFLELNNDFQAASYPRADLKIAVKGIQFTWLYDNPRDNIQTQGGLLVVPVNKVVQLDFRSTDVIHSWWVPELTGKTDAVPGYINHSWFKALHTGTYQGACAEFCGISHAEMRIAVRVLDDSAYQQFVSKCLSGEDASECRPLTKP